MKNYWLDLKNLKKLSPWDIKAAREYERQTGLPACEWVELKRKDINEKSLAR